MGYNGVCSISICISSSRGCGDCCEPRGQKCGANTYETHNNSRVLSAGLKSAGKWNHSKKKSSKVFFLLTYPSQKWMVGCDGITDSDRIDFIILSSFIG